MLEIIDRIRKSKHDVSLKTIADAVGLDIFETTTTTDAILCALFDAVEHEVTERYQLCPKDADGTPIHSGRYLNGFGYVYGVGDGVVFCGIDCDVESYKAVWAEYCTLEGERLGRVICNVMEDAKSGATLPEIMERYESRIRKAASHEG